MQAPKGSLHNQKYLRSNNIMKKFDFNNFFTQAEYRRFATAVKERAGYTFCYGERKDKMRVEIYARVCDNGVWGPENYLWSIGLTDCRDGYTGRGSPYRISELKTYTEILAHVYGFFDLPTPTAFQQSFFD